MRKQAKNPAAAELEELRASVEELRGQVEAIHRSQAVIEFELDGTILTANPNFLAAVGYEMDEIRGQHHRIFVPESERTGEAYRAFWARLGSGQYDSGRYLRVAKGGRQFWLQASYNPIFDRTGKPCKVIKFASDITEQQLEHANLRGQVDAIHRSQAVIEFELEGTILTANEAFCKAVGYELHEIRGRHHQIFVSPSERQSAAYRDFWAKLARGEFHSGQYLRVTKDGRDLWLQATYNPILDPNGNPFKVIKYASDITQEKLRAADFTGQLDAISKAQAVIEFELDGTIRTANENFCRSVGYAIDEIRGKHHRMFVEPGYRESAAYREFWAKLGRGEFDSGQYSRIAKGGRPLWLQASYNPIFDPSGRPFKVVKYASDITLQKQAELELAQLVKETTRVMSAVSGGDLSQRMEGEFKGDLETLKSSVNRCVTTLQTMVEQIYSTANSIQGAAAEIAQGNIDLSQRTEQQAASLEETAASMEQLTATVKQNATHAQTASELATSASHSADQGGKVVESAVSAMSEINASSNKIGEITTVIDEIAFQTNLLALNAAVEAARAGEQGRGFAVVATEVRNLAQRSASAAKEIKTLIKDSGEKVAQGSKLVNESGKTLREIVSSVERVSSIIVEIASASEEQASGIDQVNQTVTHLDQGVQQNAALVEEAAAASESMSEQSQALLDLVRVFSGSGGAGR